MDILQYDLDYVPDFDMSQETVVTAVEEFAREALEAGGRVLWWMSPPCDPWCSWQIINVKALGEDFRKQLEKRRKQSLTIINLFAKAVRQLIMTSKIYDRK